jgi:hypothetical protein
MVSSFPLKGGKEHLMNTGRTIFSQLMDCLPRYEFQQCVGRYLGDYRARTFRCLNQFLCMAFAQLTGRESLRDTEICLRALQTKLYHAGFRGQISRSTLAEANEHRDWRIYADFAHVLIATARRWYAHEDLGILQDQTAYAFDSTTIDLCLSLFPWARFRKHKAAVKLHTLLDLRGSIPCFISITDGKTSDVEMLDESILEPGAFYIMDRGYIDFSRLNHIAESCAFFVTRAKCNLDYSRLAYRTVDRTTGLRCDETIRLCGPKTSQEYTQPLRRVSYVDPKTGKRLVFLTNNFTLPALTIALLYKYRWRVELFFKWIKQHLRLKAFFGTSENAVKTQVWIAISVYVLVAIVKKEMKLDRPLYEILQILSISLFEKLPLEQAVMTYSPKNENGDFHNQLSLFDF